MLSFLLKIDLETINILLKLRIYYLVAL